MVLARLDVDGVRYHLEYAGHDRALDAWTDTGEALRLSPWRLGQHLTALGHAARVRDAALELDAEAYAARVLADAADTTDAGDLARWGPLALWWAAAPDGDLPPGYGLRPWTLLERADAVRCALDPDTDAFHVGRYLGALLTCCVHRSDGPEPLALPMTHGAPLLAAIARLCAPEPLLPPALADPALRRATLRLCTALGWSAAQVWRTPAGEIDQLLALLDHADLQRPRPPLSALAALPDTHTLDFT